MRRDIDILYAVQDVPLIANSRPEHLAVLFPKGKRVSPHREISFISREEKTEANLSHDERNNESTAPCLFADPLREMRESATHTHAYTRIHGVSEPLKYHVKLILRHK